MRLIRLFALLIWIIGAHLSTLHAQERTGETTTDRIFSGEPLSDVILAVAETREVDVVFDPDLVQGFTVFYRMRDEPIQETLRNILEGSGLDFVILSSGTYVIVQSPVTSPGYGSMQGRIVDAETGIPLPNAHVFLADASRGTSTNRGGQFNLPRLMPGTHTVVFSYIGYEPVELTFTIPSRGTVEPTIEMTPDPVQTSPVLVTAHHPILPTSSARAQTETLRSWSSSQDRSPLQLLTLFPGIHRGEAGGTIHLQGSPAGDHRTYLDGAPVYHPYSMGRHMGAFSPFAIDRVTLQRAGYGMEHGSHLAGRVDLRHDYSSNSGNNLILQSDPIFANMKVRMTDSDDNSWSLMGAVRSSLWTLLESPSLRSNLNDWDFVDPLTLSALQGHSEPLLYETVQRDREIDSQDLHLAGRYEATRYRSHTLSLYVGSNRLVNRLMNRTGDGTFGDRLYTGEHYNWNNGMVQSSLNWLLTPRIDWESQWSVSWIRNRNGYGLMDESELQSAETGNGAGTTDGSFEPLTPTRVQENRNRLTDLTWTQRFRISSSEKLNWIAGLETHWLHSEFQFNDLYFRASNVEEQTSQLTLMTGSEWTPAPHWFIEAGTRWSWLLSNGEIYPEPRLSIQLDRPDAWPGPTSYKLSGGLYRQFVHAFDLANPGPSSLVPDATIWSIDTRSRIPLSWHSALSVRSEITPETLMILETYLKLQPHGWITSYHRLMADPEAPRDQIETFAESGSSQAAGVSLQFRQNLIQNKLHIWAGYDWSWTRVDMPQPFNQRLMAPWTIPQQVQFRILARPSDSHTLLLTWRTRSGERWAFRNSYYDLLLPHNITGAGTFSFTTPETDRIPAHHQLDLGWIHRPAIFSPHLEIRLDLAHVAGTRQILDRSLLPVTSSGDGSTYRLVERTGPGFTPTLSVQLQF